MTKKEEVREYYRKYYLKHRAKIITRTKKWQKENPERRKEIDLRYFRKNPDYYKNYTKQYKIQKPERSWAASMLCNARQKLRKVIGDPEARFRDMPGFC